jgi:photosystem II stability/assembly factor-like uncharacterized protein
MAAFLSSNGGAGWTTVRVTSDNKSCAEAIARDPANPNTLYVGGYSGSWKGLLFKSTNGGASWTDVLKNIQGTIQEIQVDPVSPRTVYAVTWGSVWKSMNGGGSWTDLKVSPAKCLIINPKNTSELFVGTGYSGVYHSTDQGATWEDFSADMDVKYVNCLDLDPAARILYAGITGGGIAKRKI